MMSRRQVKNIDNDKVKIKNLIGVETENYPDEYDCFFDIVKSLQELDMLNSEFNKKDLISIVKSRYNNMKLIDILKHFTTKYKYFEMIENNKKEPSFILLYHLWE